MVAKRSKKAETPKDDSGPQLIGYARVSTEDQELRLQTDALESVGCLNIYSEKVSARAKRRPELDHAIMDLRPGDTLVVWRLDRLARNMRDLLARLTQIEEGGAKFRSLTESFDMSTANGRLILYVLGAAAEFESQITQERTKAGIVAIQARGLPHGAPLKFDAEKREKARQMLREKVPKITIARRLKISVSTLHQWIRAGKPKVKRAK